MLFGSSWTRKWLKQPIQKPDYCFILMELHGLERNPHLKIVNSMDLCEGLIIREKFSNGKLFLTGVSPIILPHIARMVIDENEHVSEGS